MTRALVPFGANRNKVIDGVIAVTVQVPVRATPFVPTAAMTYHNPYARVYGIKFRAKVYITPSV
jgi:hypothetical protein